MRSRAGRRVGRVKRVGALVALVVVGTACQPSESGLETSPLDGLSPNERALVADAEEWLDEESGVELADGDELEFTRLDAGPDVTHVAFGHRISSYPVLSSEIVVHILEDGTIQDATNSLTEARPVGPDEPEVSRLEAEDTALKAVPEGELVGEAELAWYETNGDLSLTWRVAVGTEDPVGSWEILVDTTSGDVVAQTDQSTQRAAECGVPAAPSACVFVPDPIFANDGTPVDRPQADGFLEGVQLQGLDDPASGRLVGEYVNVDPAGAPVAAAPESDGTWELGVDDVGFEHTMVYYWVDRTQRLIQELGFTDIRNESFEIWADVPGQDFISHFDPNLQRIELGINALYNGQDSEDAYVILHEYGHAVLDAQLPPVSGQPLGNTSAYHEGFGNLLAFFATLEERTGVGAESGPTCLGYWSYGGCVGALDRDLVYPDDVTFEEHFDGDIFTSAAYDVFEVILGTEGLTIDDCPGSNACNAARNRMLSIILTANGYLPPHFTFDDAARAYLLANEAVAGGANASEIEATFAAHGFQAASGSSNPPSASFFIQHPDGSQLDVTVDVVDPAGNSLCETIPIGENQPPGTPGGMNGRVDLVDSDCEAFLPPSPQQRWVLRIANSGGQEGFLYGFAVSDGSTPYVLPEQGVIPAGGEVAWAIDGSGNPADPGGDPDPGPEPDPDPDPDPGPDPDGGGSGDGPVATISITHPYIGDLSVFAGVADASGQVVCSVQALEPQPGEAGTGGIAGDIDLSTCASDFPPAADRIWFVQVADLATLDEGTVDELTLTGPDGEALEPQEPLPAAIPDYDPDGVVLTFRG